MSIVHASTLVMLIVHYINVFSVKFHLISINKFKFAMLLLVNSALTMRDLIAKGHIHSISVCMHGPLQNLW